MAASRLSDAQKDEIVAGYRQGATAAALASAFGCSPNTVSRVLKTALSTEEMAVLKQQRGSGKGDSPVAVDPAGSEELEQAEDPATAADDLDGLSVLAIDDADDFAGEDADQEGDELDDLGSTDDEATEQAALAVSGQEPVQCRCLSEAELPAAAYLLVDKTVELQPVALGDCPDLGPLPDDESVRQALQVYVNPRHAKRQCGRSQRVIPLPDPSLLQRTAPYLLAQGISRVVIEGSLYSLPGS
jgi:hypothetical protein